MTSKKSGLPAVVGRFAKHKFPGVVESVESCRDNDHGGFSPYILVAHDAGSHQALPGLQLDKKMSKLMEHDLCVVFGVEKFSDIAGASVYSLYDFAGWGEDICGLESVSGKRFFIDDFARRYYPDNEHEDKLAKRKTSILRAIHHAKETIESGKKELAEIKSRFIDWSRES